VLKRSYEVRLPGDWPPDSVTANGASLAFTGQVTGKAGWRYEGNRLMTVITTPEYSVHTPVRIEVRRAAGSVASRQKLDGFAGSITRLREVYDTLNTLWPLTWTPNPLIDAWQTGDRLSYRPQTAREEIARFSKVYAEGLAAVNGLIASPGAANPEGRRGAPEDREKKYLPSLQRAAALLEDGKPVE